MTVTLNLNPDVEKGLMALAREEGLSISDYLQEVMVREAARVSIRTPATGEEKAEAFLAWAESFPDTPSLSEEAISRDSMYPDRL